MKIKQLALSLILLSPVTVIADSLSFSADAGVWNESANGLYNKSTDTPVNVKNDLFWDTEQQGYLFVSLEHFVPLIPNARLTYTKISHDGSGQGNFTFDGIVYNDTFSNNIDMETLDLLLYYEVLDNVVSLDIGLNIRKLKVDYLITDTSTGISDTAKADETFPMVYALVGASPWPDLIISGEISYISFDGHTVSDATAKIAYTTSFFVGFEAGYRKQKLILDDLDGTNADLTFDGPFVGAYVKF